MIDTTYARRPKRSRPVSDGPGRLWGPVCHRSNSVHGSQAAAGLSAYQVQCANCHLPNLGGRNEAPQLAGSNFMRVWSARTTRDLFTYIQSAMPPGARGSLGQETYVNLVAFILQANGARAGTQPLTPTTSASIGAVATGEMPASLRPILDKAASSDQAGVTQVATGAQGLTVSGEVKNYVPVTDEMLRNPDPGDWLMIRRNYQAWSYSPLTQITHRERAGSAVWRGSGR